MKPLDGNDILDLWEVRCPGEEPRRFYTNMYRCGVRCPPVPLTVLPATTSRAFLEAKGLATAGNFATALEILEKLPPELANYEVVQSILGPLLFRTGELARAREAFEKAIEMNPEDPYHRLHLALVDLEEGKSEAYERTLSELLEKLPENHALRPELVCRKGLALEQAGRTEEGRKLKEKACQAGDQRCCDKPK